MRLYVCWDTAASYPLIGRHACGVAYDALHDAGHDPDVVRAYGWAKLPSALNVMPGRRAVRELTGSDEVPVLALANGEVVAGSKQIVAWAEAHPASSAS